MRPVAGSHVRFVQPDPAVPAAPAQNVSLLVSPPQVCPHSTQFSPTVPASRHSSRTSPTHAVPLGALHEGWSPEKTQLVTSVQLLTCHTQSHAARRRPRTGWLGFAVQSYARSAWNMHSPNAFPPSGDPQAPSQAQARCAFWYASARDHPGLQKSVGPASGGAASTGLAASACTSPPQSGMSPSSWHAVSTSSVVWNRSMHATRPAPSPSDAPHAATARLQRI